MMTISLFLLLCLGAILLLGLLLGGPSRRGSGTERRHAYLFVWLIVGGAAIWTINRYTYPADKVNVFGNSDYHVLEHLGYQFGDSIVLAGHKHPENALWDHLDGDALLVSGATYRIESEGFFHPFFMRTDGRDVLQNDYYAGLDVEQGLEFRVRDSLMLAIRIEPYERGDSLQYRVQFGGGKEERLSDFKALIHYGYPLAEILRHTPGWQIRDSLVAMFEGAWLLRTIQGDEDSPLTFFPSRALQSIPGLRVVTRGDARVAADIDLERSIELEPGQRFFTGLGLSRNPDMHLESEGKGHLLRFEYPEKYRLARREDNQLFLCSDLQDVAQNVIQGGFLLPVFEEEDNRFHVNATLRYRHGSSRERLSLQVNDHYSSETGSTVTVQGGEEFALRVRDRNTDLRWAMRLTDLRASNPLGRGHLFGFVIAYVVLVLLTVAWIGDRKLGVVEMSLYLLVFAFLLVRILLQWRMGVFPPVEDAGPRTFAFLRSMRHFTTTASLTGLFFVVRWAFIRETDHLSDGLQNTWIRVVSAFKPLRDRFAGLQEHDLIRNWLGHLKEGGFRKFALAYLIPWLGFLLVALIVKRLDWAMPSRFVNIAAPMTLYFFVEHIIERFRSDEGDKFLHLNPYSLFNSLFILAFLALTDAGFGIIFLLFSMLFQVYRILLRARRSTRRIGFRKDLAPALVAVLAFVAVLFGADEFIRFVFARTAWFYWLVLVPVVLVLILYFAAFAMRRMPAPSRTTRLAIAAGSVVLLALLGAGTAQNAVEKFSYVKYRAAIHSGSPDEIIEKERFATGRIGQIMRAAQNQWLINTYLRKMEPEEGRAASYFNLRPHFNKGSSYTTQTTDLVVTRYLISEHGVGVVIVLLLLLLAVTGLYSFRVNLSENHRFVPFGMLLLVFTIALFIWLTATNRFIFFGQDFPLISLTSLFTLVFSLGLILFVIGSIPVNQSGRPVRSRGGRQSVPATAIPLLVLLVVGLVLQQSRRELNEDNFNFNLSLDQARADFNELNGEFGSFQNTLPRNLPADSVVALFSRSRRDSVISRQTFTQTIYDHFVREERDKMNPDHLLYIVQRPEGDRLKYHFALNPTYYLIRPPQQNRLDWTGNLLAARETAGGVYLVGQEGERLLITGDSAMGGLEARLPEHLDQLKMAVVPASWMKGNQPAVLAWAGISGEKSPDFTLTDGTDGNRQIQPSYRDPALRLRSGEVLSLHGPGNRRMLFRYEEDFKEFLAKNIWLNGEQRLFYPLGEQLLWAYYYAGAVRQAREGGEGRHQDQRVSIDFTLTRNLHLIAEKHFRSHNWDRQRLGMVVLDGQGRIRSLTDYKPKDAIDPNDITEIHEKNREFHLRRNNHDERITFGNVNLLKLTNGAGSSVKPLMYAAVTSQYDLGWNQLRTVGIPESLRERIQDKEKKLLHFYGGRKVEIGWGGIEEHDFDPKSSRDYLIQSKNLYHSLVMFLGSYRKIDLQNNLYAPRESKRHSVFMPAWVGRDSVDFPVVDLGRGPWTLRKEGWPRTGAKGKSFFGDPGSLLGEGLFTNLGLPTYRIRSAERKDYVNIDPDTSRIYELAGPGARLYAYPELAHFYQSDRALRPENPLWFIQGMRQPTAGNDPMVLTPLKIAEMAGILFSQNRRFRATLDDSGGQDMEHAAWRVDTASWGAGGYHQFLRDNIFASLRDVMAWGTGSELGRRLRKGSPYFYYGKTGTIGDADDLASSPDKLLLLVISKGDVTKMNPAELAENKFYVVYFTGLEMYRRYKMDVVWDLFAEMVREVESSYLFQNYMQ